MDMNIFAAIAMVIARSGLIASTLAEPLDMLDDLLKENPELENSETFKSILKKRKEAIVFVEESSKMLQGFTDAMNDMDGIDIGDIMDDDDEGGGQLLN